MMKKKDMNFQPYCLLQSLGDSKPYRVLNYSLNCAETESVYAIRGEGEKHAKMQQDRHKVFKMVDCCCQGIDILMAEN